MSEQAYGWRPVIEETRTPDGWAFGTLTDWAGSDYGDAFVEAPDGTRAGLVWDVDEFDLAEISPAEEGRWGVYGIAFRAVPHSVEDFTRELHAWLPRLREVYARCKASGQNG
jgi:hypothetical protein